jgi:hypothetical protein
MKQHLALVSVAAAATLASVALPAAAEPIKEGTFALSAERLSGFYHSKVSLSNGNGSETFDRITLLGQAATGPHDLPRIGADYFIIDGLSLGGNIAIMHTSGSGDARFAGIQVNGGNYDTTQFLFAPRVGYAIMFVERVGIWPRGGFSYYLDSTSYDGGGSSTLHYFSLNLEAPFLFKVADNFAITVGPTIDVSLEGSQKLQSNNGNLSGSTDASLTAFGIAAGLVALF